MDLAKEKLSMKSISQAQYELINEAVSTGQSRYSPQALEKDLLLTDLLKSLNPLRDEVALLVFGGGTSLNKAFGILNRMSEDLDFKLVSSTDGQLSRKHISKIKSKIKNLIVNSEFSIVSENASDNNKYFNFEIGYKSRFALDTGLRSEIKLDIKSDRLETEPLSQNVKTLLFRDLRMPEDNNFWECINPGQTMVEKIIALLWRWNEIVEGASEIKDRNLVRHIYDVSQIVDGLGDLNSWKSIFDSVLMREVKSGRSKSIEFRKNPKRALNVSLDDLISSKEVAVGYQQFVSNLVAGPHVGHDLAIAKFTTVAKEFLYE